MSQTNSISDHKLYYNAHSAGTRLLSVALFEHLSAQNPSLQATNPLPVASESLATGQGIACP